MEADKSVLYSSISDTGVVDFAVEAAQDSSVRGYEMFNKMIEYYGNKVTAVGGNWTYGDNLAKVNELTRAGMSLNEAVLKTWTGTQSAIYGFTNAVITEVIGNPGSYTTVRVLFTK